MALRKRTIGTAARITPINLYTEILSIIAGTTFERSDHWLSSAAISPFALGAAKTYRISRHRGGSSLIYNGTETPSLAARLDDPRQLRPHHRSSSSTAACPRSQFADGL